MVQFQNSILECHHSFSNMFFDKIFEAHCAQILSCFGLGVGALAYNLISFPNLLIIFPKFCHNISNVTWITPSFNY